MKNQLVSRYLIVVVLASVSLIPVMAVGQSFWTSPDTIPPWVSRWAVTNVTPFLATINWSTDEPSDAMAEFCTSWMHCNNFTPLVLEFTLDHSIDLSGLSPYTKYYFYMYSRDQFGNTRVYGYRTFTTAWVPPVMSPTPLPTPVPTPTPWPTPYPSQTPISGPDVTPPWVVRWTVSDITDSSARVEWITDETSDGMVEICPSWSHCAIFTPRTNDNSTNHGVNLTGLMASKRYYFWMYSRDSAGNLRVYGYKTFYTDWR